MLVDNRLFMKAFLLIFPLVLVNPVKGWNDRIVKINVCMFHCFESGQFIRMRLSEGGSIILYSVTFRDRENDAKVMDVSLCLWI